MNIPDPVWSGRAIAVPRNRHRLMAEGLVATVAAANIATYSMSEQITPSQRCEELSSKVVARLAEKSFAAESSASRRQRRTAFEACLRDPDAFARLLRYQE